MRLLTRFVLVGLVVACGSPPPDVLLRLDPLAPGSECAWGGERVLTGRDLDGSGTLEDAEVEAQDVSCDDAPPATTLLRIDDREIEATCDARGTIVSSGVDANRDGMLQESEATTSTIVCAPARMVRIEPIPSGSECGLGGQRILLGHDRDGDALLSGTEIVDAVVTCLLPGGGNELRGSFAVREPLDVAVLLATRRVTGLLSVFLDVEAERTFPTLEEAGALFLAPTTEADWSRRERVALALTLAEETTPPTEPEPGAALVGPGAIRFPVLHTVSEGVYANEYPDLRGLALPLLASVNQLNVQGLVRLEQLDLGSLREAREFRITDNPRLADCDLRRHLSRMVATSDVDVSRVTGNDSSTCVNGPDDCTRVAGATSDYLFCVLSRDYAGGAADCAGLGGTLAVLSTEGERKAFVRSVPASFPFETAWLGLTDAEVEGTWLWADGTPLERAPWRDGEPNDSGGSEDCVGVSFRSIEAWNDIACTGRWPVVCEVPKPE